MYWISLIFLWALVFLVFASAIYHAICIYSAAAFFRPKNKTLNTSFTPPVTILKPVRGVDDHAYDCWVSCCKQDYPSYEIIFTLRDQDDPAIPLIKQLQKDYPERQIKLVISSNTIGVSAKVSNLNNSLPNASHEILVISDSDIYVPVNYLRTVIAPFVNEKVGVVTCLYRAIGSTSLAALLETIGITGEFVLGVLVARKLEGVKFALGSTIATRKKVLSEIGGFAAIADYLSDDFLIGNLAASKGYEVYISECIVETIVPDYKFEDFIKHQLRWARGTRASRPAGYVGMLFTFTTALALLLIGCFHTSIIAWVIAFFALAVRFTAALLIGGIWMGDQRLKRYFYLLPIRDLISFLIWLASFVGNTVYWRGDRFRLEVGGKLVRVD